MLPHHSIRPLLAPRVCDEVAGELHRFRRPREFPPHAIFDLEFVAQVEEKAQ